MKNISNMLSRGNLTPRERYLLLIQNDVHKSKTGKEILTAADKEALENWRAKDSSEAREWNRLNEAWKHTGRMDIEVEFIYMDAKVAYLAQLPIILKLLYYQSYYEMDKSIKSLKRLKKVNLNEAIKIGAMQRSVKLKEGLDFDYAIYQLAFEQLSSADKKCMNELYPDIETDHQYLDQEEIIANLYNGKGELTADAKDKLATLIADRSFNRYANEYQLYHYFACIPLVEVAKYFLTSKGIKVKGKPFAKNQEADDEDDNTLEDLTEAMTTYAKEHKTTIEEMLKEGALIGLNKELLDDYRPLIASNQADLFNRWLEGRALAKRILLKHIETGELKLRDRTKDESRKDMLYSKRLYDIELENIRKSLENISLDPKFKGELEEKTAFETFDGEVITGESLYNFKEDYGFVKDFKEQVDRYVPNLGIVYADDDPEHKGEHLDKELLICDVTGTGEANIFSLYGISIARLSALFNGKTIFEEESEKGKIYLKFKDPEIEQIFRTRLKDLIDGFAKLQAFKSVLEKAGKIYETDLAYHVSERIKMLREYIQQINEAVRLATNTSEESERKRSRLFRRKDKLELKEDLIIDIESIKPDENAVEDHEIKLREILGEF